MSKFKVGDKVRLLDDTDIRWGFPENKRRVKEKTVGTITAFDGLRYTVEFPGSEKRDMTDYYAASLVFVKEVAPTPRDTRAETIAYLEGKRDAAVKLAKLAQDEAEAQEKLRQKFERQVDEYNTQIELLSKKEKTWEGRRVRVTGRSTFKGETATVVSEFGGKVVLNNLRNLHGGTTNGLTFDKSELELV